MRKFFPFALLALAEGLIFFSTRRFFIGDTITWMGFRYRSIGEFLASFLHTDPMLWYRPLAQRTLISVIYPFAGLSPIPYRVAGFLLFFACTIAVFFMAKRLSRSSRAAWFAALIFAPNVTHAFTTYDAAFFPEMLFTLFCMGSLMAFVEKRWVLAGALFVGGLLCKETAVALPIALAIAWLLLPRKERGSPRSLLPYFCILAAYLVFAIGYLHIRDIHPRQLLERPGEIGQPGYQLVAGKHVAGNLDVAFSWAFGIPRLEYTEDMLPARWTLQALKVIRALLCMGLVAVLFTPRRNAALIGLGWFVAMLLPTVPMPNHFIPNYMFAPLVGFALAAGSVLDWVYEQCSRVTPRLGVALCGLLLVISGSIHAAAANQLAPRAGLLGQSARFAEESVKDVRRVHPTIPRNSLIVIHNDSYPTLAGNHSDGALFRLAYDDPSLGVWYSGDGGQPPVERYTPDRVFVFKWENNHLIESR